MPSALSLFSFALRSLVSFAWCLDSRAHLYIQCTIYARPRCMNPARLGIIRLGSDNSVKTCVSAGNERLEYFALVQWSALRTEILIERFHRRVLLGWFWLGILRFAYRFCPSMIFPSCFSFPPL